MSEPNQCIGRVATPYGPANILVGRYPSGGAIAIQLAPDGEPERWTFSVNLVPYGAKVEPDEFNVKTWSENEPLVDVLLGTGLFEDTGKRVPSGFAVSPIWRLKDAASIPPVPRRPSPRPCA